MESQSIDFKKCRPILGSLDGFGDLGPAISRGSSILQAGNLFSNNFDLF